VERSGKRQWELCQFGTAQIDPGRAVFRNGMKLEPAPAAGLGTPRKFKVST
jgi:hypothetical protein